LLLHISCLRIGRSVVIVAVPVGNGAGKAHLHPTHPAATVAAVAAGVVAAVVAAVATVAARSRIAR
jgi:hypothetical protein